MALGPDLQRLERLPAARRPLGEEAVLELHAAIVEAQVASARLADRVAELSPGVKPPR